ncbi:replication-relaxation family protein [Nocardioides rubriscoriae]|uniref:replication-relaxation family protein n=1 Tax=Nocardioides rubriscoriae TaxID=642762 RepID=UPI0011DF4E06|nr:replication-relaxation family protein [Nocardioides rubriscoriae]
MPLLASAEGCRNPSEHLLIESIERRMGGIGAGPTGTVWRVGPAGDRLLRADDHDAARARRREPSRRFLEHRMLVADVACSLTTAAGRGSFELLRIEPEPASWRDYSGPQGGRETLKPDLFAITAAGD